MSFDDNPKHRLRQTWCLSEFSYLHDLSFDEDLPKMSRFDAFLHTVATRHEGAFALALCEFKGRKTGRSKRDGRPQGYPFVFTRQDKYDAMVEAEEEHGLPGFFLYEYEQEDPRITVPGGLYYIPRKDVPLDDLRTLDGRDGPVPAYHYPGPLLTHVPAARLFRMSDPVWSAPEPG